MSSKSLSDQIKEMQQQNDQLKEFQKLLDKAMKMDLGVGRNDILKMLSSQEKNASSMSAFENKIRKFFKLHSNKDMEDFIAIICNEKIYTFFCENREKFGEKVRDDTQG